MKRFKRAKDIRMGVVGYGPSFNMGRQHLNEMEQAGMTPVAVCDIDTARLKVAQADFPGIETYASLTAMLKKCDVDFITIITPHNTHAKLALQCLRAGKSVCSEKPLAITTAQCDAMIAEARKNRLVLTTYHNRHWDGCILEAVRQIKKERVIGDVVRVEAHMGGYGRPGDWWRGSKTISGGILFDWGVHLLEYSLQLIDSSLQEVTGVAKTGFWAPQTVWKADTHEDEAFALVRFRGQQWLTLDMTTIDNNPKGDRGWLEITGTKGTYVFSGGDWKLCRKEGDRSVVITGKNPPSEGHKFYRNVVAHLVKGTKLVITGEWARRPIHILDLACQSAAKGRAMPAKYR